MTSVEARRIADAIETMLVRLDRLEDGMAILGQIAAEADTEVLA